MHMADALVSPAVGAAFWAVSAGTIAYCSARVRQSLDERIIPLMGVLAAFVFAAQMINFTIPATGSSGHLGGGLLLAVLLGPAPAFLAIASVLVVQALFFADGGLLALGCNIFNLGVIPAFIAYPLVYRKLVGQDPRLSRMVTAMIIAAVVALQLGSFGVVLQTVASGIAALPLTTFLLLMQPIHLAIGLVEGLVTALVVSFVYQARPDILQIAGRQKPIGSLPIRSLLAVITVATLLTGGLLSWYASASPDGLEWAITQVTGSAELPEAEGREHQVLAQLQEQTALLPDYALPAGSSGAGNARLATSLSGLVGGGLTLAVCLLIGYLLRKRTARARPL
ncbi:MAG: energy-coupling factor ABC transporter permease [Desulfuromonadales bacterium]|jgi:cobalt/nickel transport system permease protein